jgi:hypothetical protein
LFLLRKKLNAFTEHRYSLVELISSPAIEDDLPGEAEAADYKDSAPAWPENATSETPPTIEISHQEYNLKITLIERCFDEINT